MLKFLVLNLLSVFCLIRQGEAQAYKHKPTPTPYHDWDYLIFSQRWPVTACTEWEEEKAGNSCNLPKDATLWTIHGIWPTKTGKEGPLFCPSAIHFNPEELTPMLDDLKNYWVNIEANTKANSFWAHEWNKHGTCASTMPQLDSVPNYFKMGLKLNRQYNMANILSKGGVMPGVNSYDISFIYGVIKNALNKEPSIQCVIDKKTKESYINEIRICFDKNFELIDCDATNPIHRIRYGLNTNCNQKKRVWYIASVPPEEFDINYYNTPNTEFKDRFHQQRNYIWLYTIIRNLMWISL